jgi:Flp pilus assembly protein TadD
MPQLTVDQAFALAQQHQQAGRLSDAEQLYRQILAAQPTHAGAMEYLGVLATMLGHASDAMQLIRRAIELAPRSFSAHFHLGNALRNAGQLEGAIDSYQQALALQPNSVPVLNNLGSVQSALGRSEDAIQSYRRALAVAPDSHALLSNLARAYFDNRQYDQAIACARSSLAAKADEVPALYTLACVHAELGEPRQAIEWSRNAIAIQNDYAEAHGNLAVNLLLLGDFSAGLPEYEWRWRVKDFPSPQRHFQQPRWDGGPFAGRTLLLHAEQGLGDNIQFIRYLPAVIQRGAATAGLATAGLAAGKVFISCPVELAALFKSLADRYSPAPGIVAYGEALPEFDLHCSIMSLAHHFGTRLETIPAEVPYLFPDPAEIARWRDRINQLGDGLKIGLAWSGNPSHRCNPIRSIPFESLAAALAEFSDAQFFSLQKGGGPELRAIPPALRFFDFSGEFCNFNDAALIANLDLIITVDTSIAHLAGALARPTWLMLPTAPDWRWLLDREDSPWYPTLRLFRQQIRGDWSGVLARVGDCLRERVSVT